MTIDSVPDASRRNRVRLGRFEEYVILAALTCGQQATVNSIRDVLSGMVGLRRPQSVVTTIDRLIEKGCMTKDLEETPRPIKGGRRCRLHNVTPIGIMSVNSSINISNTLAQQAGIGSNDDPAVRNINELKVA